MNRALSQRPPTLRVGRVRVVGLEGPPALTTNSLVFNSNRKLLPVFSKCTDIDCQLLC